MSVTATALPGLPEVRAGDDLAALIVQALGGEPIRDADVLVVAHKVVSKAEGRVRRLADVTPGRRALTLGIEHGKDPRHVKVVLDESQEVIRASHGVLICVTRHGFVCANAGVDASNVPGEDAVVMLPLDPDGSARGLRAELAARLGTRPAVIVTDSFGRAWRHGQCDVTIGAAGVAPLQDWRGRHDAHGRELKATLIAVADEIAAAADLARAKDALAPVVLVRGVGQHVVADDGPGVGALLRPAAEDLFR